MLSEAEQAEFFACESVIETGWSTFVQVGMAFARIRDGRLYKGEYDSFEAYCRIKWQYGRRYVDQRIFAAQLVTQLRAICSQKKPEHENQVRPLIGLPPEQALRAWESAAAKAGNTKITARLVQNAVKEIRSESPEAPVAPIPRPRKEAQRRLIDDTIGQLLVLLTQKASHDVLREKVEALYGYFQTLFPKPTKPRR